MKYRKFGNTDLLTSEIGFGAWAIGGGTMIGTTAIGWGNVDDKESIKAIHTALDQGINFFDTADIYGLGHSEIILGNAIGNVKNAIIATKVGNVSKDEKFTVNYSKEYIIEACNASLKRLQRDTIDYYQLHTARMAHLQQGDCIEAMQQLQQEGKIRYWGISLNTFEPDNEAHFFINNSLGNGFQLVLNILNQKALPLIKAAAQKGYGIIARMPLQFGLLTGKFDNVFYFADNDHRKSRLNNIVIDEYKTAIAPIYNLCEKYNCDKTTLALSYILHYNEVSTVIPGIRNTEQAFSNTKKIITFEKTDIELIEAMGLNEFASLMELIKKQG
jgi:aryl-alcohol dehydrogenase-like predicted oxidoreductase